MSWLHCNPPSFNTTLINYPLKELHSSMHFLLCDNKILIASDGDDDGDVDDGDDNDDNDDDENALLVY